MKCWRERWKRRAIKRRYEIRKLEKRLKELTESRDLWKNKVRNFKESNNELKEQLKKTQRIIEEKPVEEKPERHSYNLKTITMLAKEKLESSISFRALSKTFCITKNYLKILSDVPTHTTITNWIHKIGHYQLMRRKEIADDWIIILDHSIQLGQDKAFVILGIREKNIDFSRPLQYHDLLPFRIESRKKWTGGSIAECVSDLKKEIGNIKYAVGDYGSDIKKGLKTTGIKHVHDITHAIALILEKIYGNDEEYQEFTKQMSVMRSRFSQTEIAHIIPPKQRKKSRYQNIKMISDWGENAIKLLEHPGELPKDEKEKIIKELGWVKGYGIFIKELSEINKAICSMEKIIKTRGLCDISVKESKDILSTLSSQKSVILKEQLVKYFEDMRNLINTENNILCTSDILESAFGKYKNYVGSNPMAGITNLVLCIAAFTSSMTEDVVKEALESTTTNDIKKWTEDFIGPTLLQKRKSAFAYA